MNVEFENTSSQVQTPASVTRRRFVRNLIGAGAAVGALGPFGAQALARDPISRRGNPRLLLSLAAYSFRDRLTSTDAAKRMTLFDFIDFCADHGCHGAELTSYYFEKNFGTDYLVQLKRRAFLRGLAISGTAVGNNFAQPDGPDLDGEISATKRWIDNAAFLGAPHIRVFAGTPRGGIDQATAKRQCIKALEICGEYAATKGVWLGLENHGGIVSEVSDLLEIIRAVSNPWVGVNLDTGNFYGEADPYDDMARLAPYAVNVQLKVEINRRGKGKEQTDLMRVIKILSQVNYQGYVALEYEAAEDPMTAMPQWLARMREAFAATAR
ncbi:MAG: sugar phosphate isomerase/epimerase family protein [Verrucomicrobiota bacterium]|nr:sugar phosphate isomerase/epimerase family protein [Verrucomicrobiota bacterium]